MIEARLKKINQELDEFNCSLVAVSKGQSVQKIKEAYACGQKIFGENYLQEFLSKKEELKNLDISWHYIGRLQTKKIKNLVGEVSLIHSVSEKKHLLEIDKRALEKKVVQKILLQVNLVNEESKAGFTIAEVEDLNLILSNTYVCGFMFMPPIYKSMNEYKKFYEKVDRFHSAIKNKYSNLDLSHLSMGTSGDYQVALEFGSTWIRLGRTIFGERQL